MYRVNLLRLKKFILSFFLLLFFTSCSASNHAGVTYVDEPQLDVVDEQTWFTYYQDQFDAFEGSVLSPPENYPMVARQAYQRASVEWNDKVSSAKTNTMLIWIGTLILVPTTIMLIAMP